MEMINEQMSVLAKRTIYDSVFTNLFKAPEYTIQLYKALHPEDTTATAADVNIVTLENILLNQPYNDLGFTIGNRLLILVEAQSTWSYNIVVRGLLYMAQTIQNHLIETKQNVYGAKKVSFPEPEFYVIYTGERDDHPSVLSLTNDFFNGRKGALDVNVKMVYDGQQGDIINQYVMFTRIYKEQLKRYGRTQEAVLSTIQICKDRDVLKSYLENREKEVVDIMMTLFNREQVLEAFIEDERRQAATEQAIADAKKMKEHGITEDVIASILARPVSEVRNWLISL